MTTTLSGPARCEREIRKSRFIARAAPAASPALAMGFIENTSDPQASHNCWAYRVGDRYRFSDDGEPAGTAGKPILGAIEKQGLDRVVVVVTRYFGGTKLGAGGLARAYSGTAAECLRTADRLEIRNHVTVRFEGDFDTTGALHASVERLGARILRERHTASGISADIRVEKDSAESLMSALREATRGNGVLSRV